jgi:hypothetical protein
MTPDEEVVTAALKASGTVYTVPALREAAALLGGLYAAGDGHGVHPDDRAGQGADLPGTALRTITARYRRAYAHCSPCQIQDLYRRMETELAEAGIPSEGRYRGRLLLPRFAETPPWGWSGEAALTIAFSNGDGWTFQLAQERTPVIDVVAPSEAAVAELAAELLTGRRRDPVFLRP